MQPPAPATLPVAVTVWATVAVEVRSLRRLSILLRWHADTVLGGIVHALEIQLHAIRATQSACHSVATDLDDLADSADWQPGFGGIRSR